MPTSGEYTFFSTSLDDDFPFSPLRLDTLLENENINGGCVLEGKRLHENNVEAWLEQHGTAREKEIWELLLAINPRQCADRLDFTHIASQYLPKIKSLLKEAQTDADTSGRASPVLSYLEARLLKEEALQFNTILEERQVKIKLSKAKELLTKYLQLGFDPGASFLEEAQTDADTSGRTSPVLNYLGTRLIEEQIQQFNTIMREMLEKPYISKTKELLTKSLQLGFEPAASFFMTFSVETVADDNDAQEVERLFLEYQDNEECQLTASQILIQYPKIPFSEKSEGILFEKLWQRAQNGHIDALRFLFLLIGDCPNDDNRQKYAQNVLDLLEKQAKTQKDACALLAMYKFKLVRFDNPAIENTDGKNSLDAIVHDMKMIGSFLDKLTYMEADGPRGLDHVHPEWEQQRPLFEQAYALGDLWSGLFLAHQYFQTTETSEQCMELLEKLADTDNYPPAQAYLATLRCTRMTNKDRQFNDNERTHTLMRTAAMQGGSLLLEKQYTDYLLMKVINKMDDYYEKGEFTEETAACLDELVQEMKKARPWACLAIAKLVLCGNLDVTLPGMTSTECAACCLSLAVAHMLDDAVVFTIAAMNCYPELVRTELISVETLTNAHVHCYLLGKPLSTLWMELNKIGLQNWLKVHPITEEYDDRAHGLATLLFLVRRRYGGAGSLLHTLRILTTGVLPGMTNPELRQYIDAVHNPTGHRPVENTLRIWMYGAGRLYYIYYDLFIGVILAEALFWLDKTLSPKEAVTAGEILWPCVTDRLTSLRKSQQFMFECLQELNVDIEFFKQSRKLVGVAPKVHMARKQRTKTKKQRKRKK